LDLVGDKWTLLIVRDLVSGPRRFVELQRVLPGISTEQLRSRLNRMVADGMLTRKRYREVPPRVDYELTERSRELAPVLGELARWGYDWTWGPPRPSERLDLGAVFRLIPGLMRTDGRLEGTVELTVSDGRDGEPLSYRVTLSEGRASLVEGPPGKTDAYLRGSCEDWIAALTPPGRSSRIRRGGNRPLADELLELIGPGVGRAVASEPEPVPVSA
jgi:DNA-binding HxlR family transcriptional regulator